MKLNILRPNRRLIQNTSRKRKLLGLGMKGLEKAVFRSNKRSQRTKSDYMRTPSQQDRMNRSRAAEAAESRLQFQCKFLRSHRKKAFRYSTDRQRSSSAYNSPHNLNFSESY